MTSPGTHDSLNKQIKSRFSGMAFVVSLFIFCQFLLPKQVWSLQVVNTWATNSGACVNNSTFDGLTTAPPYNEQMGQFAVYSGVGVAYESVATGGTSISVPALPAGATIIAIYLLQIGDYTPTCCGLGTCTTVSGYSSCTGDGLGNPTTATTTFNGAGVTGPVTGYGNYVDMYLQPYWGADGNDNWTGGGAYNALFTLPNASISTAGGTYTLTEQPGGGEMPPTSTLFIVYSVPSAQWNGVVALADGLYFWHAQDDTSANMGLIHYGVRPLPTTVNWNCTGYTLCNPTSAQFTRSGDAQQPQTSLYTDQIITPGTPPTITTAPTVLWQSAQAALPNVADLPTYVNPLGGFHAGDTQFTWDLGNADNAKSSFAVNGLAVSFQCPLTVTTAATLVKSESESTANAGDTITYALTYTYQPTAISNGVTDNFTNTPGVCVPYNWSRGIATVQCFTENGANSGAQGALYDNVKPSQGEILYNNSSWGSDGTMQATMEVLGGNSGYTEGLVFDYQGSGVGNGYQGYVLMMTQDAGGQDIFTLYAGLPSAAIGTWSFPNASNYLPDAAMTTVSVTITNSGAFCGVAQEIDISTSTGGVVGHVCNSAYTSGFSGFWRDTRGGNENDELRFSKYVWTPNCPAANNVVVADTLPANLCYVGPVLASPAPTSSTGGHLFWNIGTVNCGTVQTLTFTATLCSPPTTAPCMITNTSSISSSSFATIDSNTVVITMNGGCTSPTDTPTKTVTVTPTVTVTKTPSVTVTVTPTVTVTITPSITVTKTPSVTVTVTPTITPSVTVTITPSITVTKTPSVTVTVTPTITPSVTVTITPSITVTKTPSVTVTVTPTVTVTVTPSITVTKTPSITVTVTPTVTVTITPSVTVTKSPTITVTVTPTVTDTQTFTTASVTITVTWTVSPTVTLTNTPTVTVTKTPSVTVTNTPSVTVTNTPSVTVTITPTVTVTNTPTVTQTNTHTTASVTITLTSTDSPTITRTNTPTITVTDTPTVTVTITHTTPTNTMTLSSTATPSDSPTQSYTFTQSETRTYTASYTASPTATDSPTNTITWSPSVTRTDSPTTTDSPTRTYTLTSTDTRTDTPTYTDTPTDTPSSTMTTTFTSSMTWTPSVTPMPRPFNITVSIFNSAGELVKSLYNGPSAYDPSGFTVSRGTQNAAGNIPVTISYLGTGAIPGSVWDTTNNNGQPVAAGTYFIQVQVTNNNGTLNTYNQEVSIVSGGGRDNLSIFNSAGELVDQIPVGFLTAPALGLTLVGSSTGVAGAGSAHPIEFKVEGGANSTPTTIKWDGTNSQGQAVQSGVYQVRLVFVEPGTTSEVIKVIPVAIVNPGNNGPQKTVDAAVVAPQPFLAKNGGAGLTVRYVVDNNNMQMSARVYNLAGQLVLEGADGGSGRFTLQANQLASGIYIVELQMNEGRAVVARRLTKIAVVH